MNVLWALALVLVASKVAAQYDAGDCRKLFRQAGADGEEACGPCLERYRSATAQGPCYFAPVRMQMEEVMDDPLMRAIKREANASFFPSKAYDLVDVAFGDMDGDNRTDAVVIFSVADKSIGLDSGDSFSALQQPYILPILLFRQTDSGEFQLVDEADPSDPLGSLLREELACQGVGIGDLNNDGFQDVVVTDVVGSIRAYLTNGTSKLIFEVPLFEGNVFGGFASPTVVDFDGDGWPDVWVLDGDGRPIFLQNEGVLASPDDRSSVRFMFISGDSADNPLAAQNVRNSYEPDPYFLGSNIAFADLDQDGDLDAFIVHGFGIRYLCNDGFGTFTMLEDDLNPFNAIESTNRLIFDSTTPQRAMLLRKADGSIPIDSQGVEGTKVLRIIGYTEQVDGPAIQLAATDDFQVFPSPVNNQFGIGASAYGDFSSFHCAALKHQDGTQDCVAMKLSGELVFFENQGLPQQPLLAEVDRKSGPFAALPAFGQGATFAFFDANGDGFADIFVGAPGGGIALLLNNLNQIRGDFVLAKDDANPLLAFGEDLNSRIKSLSFHDYDGDGLDDCFIASTGSFSFADAVTMVPNQGQVGYPLFQRSSEIRLRINTTIYDVFEDPGGSGGLQTFPLNASFLEPQGVYPETWELSELVWSVGNNGSEAWMAFNAPTREAVDGANTLLELFGLVSRANTLIVSVQLLPAQGEFSLGLSLGDALGLSSARVFLDSPFLLWGAHTIFVEGLWSPDILPNQPPINISLPDLRDLPLGSDGSFNMTAETAELYAKDYLYNRLLRLMGTASTFVFGSNDFAPPPRLSFVDIDGDGAFDLFAVLKGGIVALKGDASSTFGFGLNPFAPGTTVFPRSVDGEEIELGTASAPRDSGLYYKIFDIGSSFGWAGGLKATIQSVTTLDLNEDGLPEMITWSSSSQKGALALYKPIKTSNGLFQYDTKSIQYLTIDPDSEALLFGDTVRAASFGIIAALRSSSDQPLLFVNGYFFQLDREDPFGASSDVRVRLVQDNATDSEYFAGVTNWHNNIYPTLSRGPLLPSCAVSFKFDIDGDSLYDGVAFHSQGFKFIETGKPVPPNATLKLTWHPSTAPGSTIEGEVLLSSLLSSQVLADYRASVKTSYCPRLVDIDEDGDLDLVLSIQVDWDNAAPQMFVFRNEDDEGSLTFKQWSLSTLNPFLQQDLQAISGALVHEFVDMDNDGDLDLLGFIDVRSLRAFDAGFVYFRNIALDCSSECMVGRGICAQSRDERADVFIPELQDFSVLSTQAAGGRCACYEPYAGNACEQCAPNHFSLDCSERCPSHSRTFLEPGELVYPNGPTLEHCQCVPPFVRVNTTTNERFSCACPPGYGYDGAFDTCLVTEKGFFSATSSLASATPCPGEYFTTSGLGATSELDCICEDTFVLTQLPDGARECTCPEDKQLDEELGFCVEIPLTPTTDFVLLSASGAGAALLSLMLVCCCINRKRLPFVMPIRLPFGCNYYFFISYKQSTGTEYAQGIYEILSKRGYPVWMDKHQAKVNFNEMVRGVKASAMYVLVLSEGALDSPAIMLELATAVQNDKPIMLCHENGFPFATELDRIGDHHGVKGILRKLFQAINSVPAPRSGCNRNDARKFLAETIRIYRAKGTHTYQKVEQSLLSNEVDKLSERFSIDAKSEAASDKVVPHFNSL